MIQVEGNRTEDRRKDVVCRSDHEWISVGPLRIMLARGEIAVDGHVRSYWDWEAGIRALYEPSGNGVGDEKE